MKRRDFLKFSGALAAQTVLASTALESIFISTAHGQSVSVNTLKQSLNPKEALVVVPTDALAAKYQSAFNKRTLLTPSVRVLCTTPQAVATAIQWAQTNNVPLALRCGGHSFEGLSQSTGLVIDTRLMSQISVSQSGDLVSVGGGALLGKIYEEVSKYGRVIPAGTCPTVGSVGHTLGGGFGLLARPLGLAADSLTAVELVDARGNILVASETQNKDLFWALRGGGGGSFGVVTKMQYRTHKVAQVVVFGISWTLPLENAMGLLKAWQQWAPNAPSEMTTMMKTSKNQSGTVNIRFIGQSIGSEDSLNRELKRFTTLQPSDKVTVKPLAFFDAVKRFGGNVEAQTESVLMKGKSDYIKKVMSDQGIKDFLTRLPVGVDVMFDGYGGAVRNLKDTDTAFAHREETVSSLQYYTQWSNSSQTSEKLAMMRDFHNAMRPYMSGGAYVNYCDLDIKNYAEAYWGKNLDRLISLKSFYDPQNFFRHAQSIPLKKT